MNSNVLVHSKKRRLQTIGGLLATAAVIAACSTEESSGTAADGDEKVVIIWADAGPQNEAQDAAFAAYQAEHPNVEIRQVNLGVEYTGILQTQLAGGRGPDIMQVTPRGAADAGSVDKLVDSGVLAPLGDLTYAEVAEEAAIAAGTIDDELYYASFGVGFEGPIYNVDLVEELGLEIPETWSDVLQFCADVRAKGKVAFGLGLQEQWTSRSIVFALLASLSKDFDALSASVGDSTMDYTSSPEWRAAFEGQQEMIDAGCFNDSPAGTSTISAVMPAVLAEEYVGVVGASALVGMMYTNAEEQGIDLNLEMRPLPARDGEDRMYSVYAKGYGVNADSEHVEVAKDVLDFWATTPEYADKIANLLGLVPVIPSESFEVPSYFATAEELRADGRVVAGSLVPTRSSNAFLTGIQAIFIKQKTGEEVLADMQETFESDAG